MMSTVHKLKCYAYDKSGRLICTGVNSYTRTNKLQRYFAKKVGRSSSVYVHAEMAALSKAIRSGRIVKHIHVSRFDAYGNPVLARPCSICMAALEAFQIKVITWTGEVQ